MHPCGLPVMMQRVVHVDRASLTPADEFINALTGAHMRNDMIRAHVPMLASVLPKQDTSVTAAVNSEPTWMESWVLGWSARRRPRWLDKAFTQILLQRVFGGARLGELSLFMRAYHSPRDRLRHRQV